MPNHVSSVLTITGPIDEIKRFVAAVDRSKNDPNGKVFDFNGVVRMPEELRGTSSPVRIQTQEQIDALWADWRKQKENKEDSGPMGLHSFHDDKPFGLGITKAKYDELISKYGCADWYTWSIVNYGTKWGAYDCGEWAINDDYATISYNTAWSPATEFFVAASKQFPTLTFTTEGADEGGGFIFRTIYGNGEIVSNEDFDWKSDEGIEIRKAVGYYYDDEDSEEEDESDSDSTDTVANN